MAHATAQYFWSPPPGALGRGQKVKYNLISITKSISKIFKPNFVRLLTMERYKTYQTGFLFGRLGHAPGVGLGAGIFLVSSGAEIRPLSQWDLGDFFPNLKKKFPISKKKKKKIFFRIFTHTHTHTLHNDNLLELHPIFLQFNGNSISNS